MRTNELFKEYSRVKLEIGDAERGVLSGDALNSVNAAAFARTRAEGILRDARGIMDSICELYASYVTRDEDGKLTVTGSDIPRLSLSEDVNAELTANMNAMRTAIAALASDGLSDVPDTDTLRTVFLHYNAFIDILSTARSLEERALKDGANIASARADALRLELDGISDELCALEDDGAFLGSHTTVSEGRDNIAIPLGYLSLTSHGETYDLPYYWDFSENGVCYLEVSDGDLGSQDINTAVSCAVLSFLASYPGASKRILLCDSLCDSGIITLASDIAAAPGCASLFTNCDSSRTCLVETDLTSVMRELSALRISERIAAVGGDIFGYNEENPQNIQAPVLVILRGFIGELGHSTLTEMRTILRSAADAGVFFLVVDEPSDVTSADDTLFPEDTLRLKINSECGVFTDADEVLDFCSNMLDNDFELDAFLDTLVDAIDADENFVPLESLDDTHSTDSFSSALNIPIGKDGGETVSISLRVDSPMAHCSIFGMSGSGKSTLMHDLILGAASRYSPSELQMWIFDFKTGSELALYEGLKHVRRMSLNNRSKDASDLMHDIIVEMRRRHELMKASHVNNIVDYNERMRLASSAQLPRLIIFIDEYTEIRSHKCILDFETAALQGRSAGISFIISSVVYDSLFKNVIDQANHKIEFMTNARGGSASADSERDRLFLRALKGNCIYSDGTVSRRMRVAFPGKSADIEREISRINAKYSDFAYERPIVAGSASAASHKREEQSAEEASALYRTKRRIVVPVGADRDGEEAQLILGRERPRIVLLGDEARCAGVELDVASSVLLLSEKGVPNVYYVDLYRAADRMPNPIADSDERGFVYARTNKDISEVICELYSILLEREQCLDNDEPVGGPLMLMLHGAEYLLERADAISAFIRKANPRGKEASLSIDEEAEAILSRLTSDAGDVSDDRCTNVPHMISKIVSAGARVRIYTSLHIENPKELQSVLGRLLSMRLSLNDFVIAPQKAEGESVPAAYLTDYLSAVGVPTSDYERDGGMISAGELRYAFFVSGGVLTRFIPYER